MLRVSYIRRECNTRLRLDSIFSTPASVNNTSGIHDFSLAFVLLAFCFYRILTLGLLFLAGSGHIDSVLAGFMGEYLDQPACSIGEHSGSQSSCPRARLVHARIFGPVCLFDWRALRESELLSMGGEDLRGCWYP